MARKGYSTGSTISPSLLWGVPHSRVGLLPSFLCLVMQVMPSSRPGSLHVCVRNRNGLGRRVSPTAARNAVLAPPPGSQLHLGCPCMSGACLLPTGRTHVPPVSALAGDACSRLGRCSDLAEFLWVLLWLVCCQPKPVVEESASGRVLLGEAHLLLAYSAALPCLTLHHHPGTPATDTNYQVQGNQEGRRGVPSATCTHASFSPGVLQALRPASSLPTTAQGRS